MRNINHFLFVGSEKSYEKKRLGFDIAYAVL